jgi:hypothetical protein
MKPLLTTPLLILLFIFSACNDSAQDQQNAAATSQLNQQLPGTWEAVSVQVQLNSVNNIADSNEIFTIKEEEWIGRLGVKPVKTFYQADNKYRQEFTGLNDSIMSLNRGMWNVFGDTLMMIEPTTTYQYTVMIKSGLAEFRAMVDWDGDGEEDDAYLGVHRKISKYTE